MGYPHQMLIRLNLIELEDSLLRAYASQVQKHQAFDLL